MTMVQKQKHGWLKHLDFIILDLICLEVSYLLAYWIRMNRLDLFSGQRIYININVFLVCIELCYVLLRSEYKDILKRGTLIEARRVLIQNIVVWALVMFYIYMSKQVTTFSRVVFIAGFIFSIVLMFLVRVIWKKNIRSRLTKGSTLPYLLVITTLSRAKKMMQAFADQGYSGYNLLGCVIIDGDLRADEAGRLQVVCRKEDLREYLKKNIVDEVLINISSDDERIDVRGLYDTLLSMGITVNTATDFSEYDLPNAYIKQIGGYICLSSSISPSSAGKLFVKRIIDIAAGLVGSIITLILFIFVAPAIYKASPGPIFFRQERVGKNGRKFKIFKFRSMYPDAEERKQELMEKNKMKGLMFKVDNDPRIIGSEKGPGNGIGNFIRRTSIDEFPQFFNILKGDMSLVGIRPPTADEFKYYDLSHKVRLSMKPGLTGLWQVSGRNEMTDFEEIIKLDRYYIEKWSLKLDIKIILKTFKVVLTGKGAE